MTFETPHGYRNGEKPEDIKNALFVVRAVLMGRNPGGEAEWVERYAERFRTLFESDDAFREMLLKDMTDAHIRSIQERLDAAT
jgi:hypothetical protein